jgi:hypothetical protein
VARPAPPGRAGRAGTLSTASLKTLASKLGVSTSRLKTAMEKSRPDRTSGQPPTGDPTAALAKELDLSTAKVQAAMKAAGMGGGAPPGGAAPPSGAAERRRAVAELDAVLTYRPRADGARGPRSAVASRASVSAPSSRPKSRSAMSP